MSTPHWSAAGIHKCLFGTASNRRTTACLLQIAARERLNDTPGHNPWSSHEA